MSELERLLDLRSDFVLLLRTKPGPDNAAAAAGGVCILAPPPPEELECGAGGGRLASDVGGGPSGLATFGCAVGRSTCAGNDWCLLLVPLSYTAAAL